MTFGRLGNVVKYLGYCHAKDLIPTFNNIAAQNVANRIFSNASKFLSEIEKECDFRYFETKAQIHDILFSDFLDPRKISQMSIIDVLRFRTKLWGNAVEEREKFFRYMKKLAEETADSQEAKRFLKTEFKNVLEKSSDLKTERKVLGWNIKFDIGEGVLSAGASIASGVLGATSSVSVGIASSGLVLAAGGVWALQKVNATINDLEKIRNEERKLERSAFYNVIKGYEKITRNDI